MTVHEHFLADLKEISVNLAVLCIHHVCTNRLWHGTVDQAISLCWRQHKVGQYLVKLRTPSHLQALLSVARHSQALLFVA